VARRKPRLTYLITGLQFGGANIGMVRLLSELSPEEFDVTVVSVTTTSDDVVPMLPDHITLHKLDAESKFALHELLPLVRILRETDILVCSLFHATAVGTTLGRVLNVPTMIAWHHNTNHPNRNGLRNRIYRYAYRANDRILADSVAVERLLIDDFDIDQSKISIVPIAGVDTERFRPGTSQSTNSGVTDVVTVGRLTEQKGYRDLLTCAERLGSAYHFHIVGTGPERATLEREAPSNVSIEGKIASDQLPDFLGRADIYFQPSKWEGLCMTVIEAMACGLPVVASAVGGITESTVRGETGFLCEPEDVDCFCTRIRQLGNDSDLRREMGQNGRERVIERYSADVLADAFRDAVAAATHR